MGLIDTVKDIAVLVQKADNIELIQKVLELQTQLMEQMEEMNSLRSQLAEAQERLTVRDSLVFVPDGYYRQTEAGVKGPYCTGCYDSQGLLITLHKAGDPYYYQCPNCDTFAPVGPPEVSS